MRARSMRKTFGGGEDFGGGSFRTVKDEAYRASAAKAGTADDGGNVGVGCELVPPATPASQKDGDAAYPVSVMGAHTLCNHGKGGENQDSYVASASGSGSKSLIGVFDGHGAQGKHVSQFVSEQIAKSLFSHKELHSNPVAALESAFLQSQQMIERTHSFDAYHSGSTAVAAYRHRNRLYVANVGDSRAVLGCSQGSSSRGEGLRAVELSSDQRPDREDERSRILAQGGAIHPSCVPMRQTFGGPTRLVRVGPERVWDRAGRCGLCVTRSMGDLGMRPFVVANPEVAERILSPKDKLIILGSDGVWDRMASQEAVDIAARHRDPAAAAREITSIARQRWHAQTQGQMSDDITAVVMNLEHDTPPPTRGSSACGGAVQLPSTAPVGRRGPGKAEDFARTRNGEAAMKSRLANASGRYLESLRPLSSTSSDQLAAGDQAAPPLVERASASRGGPAERASASRGGSAERPPPSRGGGGDRLPPMAPVGNASGGGGRKRSTRR